MKNFLNIDKNGYIVNRNNKVIEFSEKDNEKIKGIVLEFLIYNSEKKYKRYDKIPFIETVLIDFYKFIWKRNLKEVK